MGEPTIAQLLQAIASLERRMEALEQRIPPDKKVNGSGIHEPAFRLAPYLDAHTAVFPGSTPPAGRFGKVFKALEAKHGADETLRRWKICLVRKATFATPEELAAHWSAYDNQSPQLLLGTGTSSPSGRAALVLQQIIDLTQEHRQPGQPITRYIRRAQVQDLGPDVLAAYDAIGGAERVLNTDGTDRSFLIRDFAQALGAAHEQA